MHVACSPRQSNAMLCICHMVSILAVDPFLSVLVFFISRHRHVFFARVRQGAGILFQSCFRLTDNVKQDFEPTLQSRNARSLPVIRKSFSQYYS